VPAAPADRSPAVLLGPGGCRASWVAVSLGRGAAGAVATAAAVDRGGCAGLAVGGRWAGPVRGRAADGYYRRDTRPQLGERVLYIS
jgi:hypothetical protein